jgi:hypothetical protein
MAEQLKTQIVINANPQKVWQVLTKFNEYPNWNPFIKELTGDVRVGGIIKARLQPEGQKGMVFKPKVLSFDVNKRFSWQGHLFMPGIFDGEHIFELIDNGNGTTTFIQRENFKGILVPFLAKMLDGATKQGFESMNQKLKDRVEAN